MGEAPDPGAQLASAIESGEVERLAHIASRNVWRLFAAHHADLREVVTSLPLEVLHRFPALHLIHPSAGVVLRSRGIDLDVFNSYVGVGGEEHAMIALLKMVSARASGDILTAVTFGKYLGELIRREQAGDVWDPTGPMWFFHEQIGSTYLCAGSGASALGEFATARQYGETYNNHDARRTAAGRTALAFAVRGAVDDAERALAGLTKSPPLSEAFHSSAIKTERTAAALIEIERMGPQAGEAVSELDEADAPDIIWPFILLARARYLLAEQRPEEALETVRVAELAHFVQPGTFACDVVAATRIEAQLALGNIGACLAIIDGQPRPGPHTQIGQLRTMIHAADFAEANRIYRALVASSWPAPVHHVELHLLKACLESLQFGQVSTTLAQRLADVAETGSYRRLFTGVPLGVITHIRHQLPARRGEGFDEGIAGLRFRSELRPRPVLTAAEQRVLSALTTTATIADIADALGVSVNTVKTQLRSLYRKLEVTSRIEAIAAGERHSLVTDSIPPRTLR